MTRRALLVLLFPCLLQAGSQRIIKEPNASKETNAAINLNFSNIDTQFRDVMHKSLTEDVPGEKHFGTITVTSATIDTLYVSTISIGSVSFTYPTGLKNRVINPSFAINQRSTGAATDDL